MPILMRSTVNFFFLLLYDNIVFKINKILTFKVLLNHFGLKLGFKYILYLKFKILKASKIGILNIRNRILF